MNCDEARILLHGHLDGELDLVRDLEVERHLEECPRCAREFATLRAMRTRLREETFHFEAPAELKEKIRRALPSPPRAEGYSSRRGGFVPRAIQFAIPLAIGAMLTLFIAPRTLRPSGDETIAREVVASHVRSMMGSHLMDVASTDQHTVKPWFNDKLDFSPQVKDLSAQGFPLAGGRLEYLGGKTVAALVYRRRQHIVNLFTWPSARESEMQLSRQGYNLLHWSDAGMSYWAVSDIPSSELEQFREAYRK